MSDIRHQTSDMSSTHPFSAFPTFVKPTPARFARLPPPREGTSGYSARMSVFLLPVFVFLYNKIRIPIDYPLRKIVQ